MLSVEVADRQDYARLDMVRDLRSRVRQRVPAIGEDTGPASLDSVPFFARLTGSSDAQLQEFCEYLNGFDLDLMGTVSFSDKYAAAHRLYSLRAALLDVERGLHSVPMRNRTLRGFRGRYVLCGEWHPSGRQVPHVHLALDSMGVHDKSRMCKELWSYFVGTRGRCRFEPMRDRTIATLYGMKDTIKSNASTRPACDSSWGAVSVVARSALDGASASGWRPEGMRRLLHSVSLAGGPVAGKPAGARLHGDSPRGFVTPTHPWSVGVC
jgi:hypothetical protein